jgi:hypothetical protein
VTTPISDLITYLNTQNFGLTNIVARRAAQGQKKPYAVVSRSGGDRNATLDGNDQSLIFTTATIEIFSSQPGKDEPIGESMAVFLEDSISVTMGSRTLFGCIVDGPEDFENQPVDMSDNWNGGTRLTVHLEHN